MNKVEKIKLSFLLIVIVITSYCCIYNIKRNNKRKYYFCNDKSNLSSVNKLAEIIKSSVDIIPGKVSESVYILPCGTYQQSRKDLIHYMNYYTNKTFFLTPNNSIIGNKYLLWKTLVNYYGIENASTVTPYSYLMPDDYKKYKKEYVPKIKMIFKTNDQRQEGLYITNSLISLNMVQEEKFIVAQRFMTNSLLFQNKKITFRLYLVLITGDNGLNAYVYDDGLVYYTKNDYSLKNNKEFNNIASFYDSQKLYENGYPLTLQSFLETLHQRNADKILKNAINNLKKLILAIEKPIFDKIHYNGNRCCEVFGVDFFTSETYNCYILECNIGPGMEPFNNKDGNMRNNLFKSMIELLEKGQSNKLRKLK